MDILGRGWLYQYTLKSALFLSNFPPNLTLYFKRLKLNINRKIQSIFLVQNFTSFLMDSIIFALGLFLRLKNADKVDPLKIQCFWSQIYYSSTLLAFLSHKRCPSAKRNKSNRKLVKFWTRKMLHIFLFIIFRCGASLYLPLPVCLPACLSFPNFWFRRIFDTKPFLMSAQQLYTTVHFYSVQWRQYTCMQKRDGYYSKLWVTKDEYFHPPWQIVPKQ